MSETIVVTHKDKNIRIDKFLSEYFDELSRSYLSKLIEDGKVLVNNQKVKNSYKVLENDSIYISDTEPEEVEIMPQDIKLDILFEDSDVIVVNKPKSMVVHPDNVHKDGTLVNALLYHCTDLSGINGVIRPGIVHRIDMDTTGSVIACKNDYAHEKIAEQLSLHSLNRTYLAIVCGNVKEEEGRIDLPIGRDEKNRKRMAVNYRNGKQAVTNYKVLKRFEKYTLVECRLQTGRTHQIRVHMNHLGYPLLGDEIYGNRKNPYPQIVHGQCLHAYILGFVHPRSNEYIETRAPIPEYFEKLLSILE